MMKKILYNLGRFLALFYFLKDKWLRVRKVVRNGYLSSRFYSIGKNSCICEGVVLHDSKYIKIGNDCYFGKNAVLTTWGEERGTLKLTIGDGCAFGEYIHLTAFNKIVIGNNVLTGRWVTISDNSHGRTDMSDMKMPPRKRPIYSKGSVIIEDDVWIGDKATILAGVTIGRGAIIGANAVVTKDVPPYSIAVGSPIRIIHVER